MSQSEGENRAVGDGHEKVQSDKRDDRYLTQSHGGENHEDRGTDHVETEDLTWLELGHERGGDESANRVHQCKDGEERGGHAGAHTLPLLLRERGERGEADGLQTDVHELGDDAEDDPRLLDERAD